MQLLPLMELKKQVIKLQDDEEPMKISFASATDANNTEGETETIRISKIDESSSGGTEVLSSL